MKKVFSIRVLIAAIVLLLADEVPAQDTVQKSWKDRLDFDIATGWYKQNGTSFRGETVNAVIPDILSRRKVDPSLQRSWNLIGDEATDNPLWHGAMYIEMAGKVKITDSVFLRASVVAENRTFSGGLYTPGNLAFYPKFFIKGDKTLDVFNQKILIGAEGGYRDSFRLMEGLTVYNMDVDNFIGYIKWKKLRLSYIHFGDMIFNSGLGIDDMITTMASLEEVNIGKDWKADFRLAENGIAHLIYDASLFSTDVSAGFYKGGTRIYGQASYLNASSLASKVSGYDGKTYAGFVGIRHTKNTQRLYLNTFFEARYYGASYNRAFKYEGIYYRQPHGFANFGFIGSSLYPIMLYNRPYSKWPVYTEYTGYDVTALNLYADVKYRLFRKTWVRAEADWNAIKPGDRNLITLLFYKLGLTYDPAKNTSFFAGLSNKGMNLDKHYPDFYAYTRPIIHFEFIRTFGW